MLWPKKLPWADVVVAAAVVLGWAAYAASYFRQPPQERSVLGPLLTFLFVAGPALVYLRGRFPGRYRAPTDDRLSFTTTVPEPEAEGPEDAEPLPLGRPVLELLADELERRGFKADRQAGITLHSHYAWELWVHRPPAGKEVQLLVQGDGVHLLLIAHGPQKTEVLEAVLDFLQRDPRFAHVQRGEPARGPNP